MSEGFPLWQLVLVAIVAFVAGRVTARSSGRTPDRYQPPAGTSATAHGRPGAGIDLAGRGSPGIGIDAGLRGEIEELSRQGRKIEAIKLARERLGIGLKEAKDLVESL